MKQNKLNFGDKVKIARALDCNKKTVEFVLNKTRGKRNTSLQACIKLTAKFIVAQNNALFVYCAQLKEEMMSSKRSTKQIAD